MEDEGLILSQGRLPENRMEIVLSERLATNITIETGSVISKDMLG